MKFIFLCAFVCVSSFAFGQWTSNGSSLYYNSGSVGIGTSSPQTMLHLQGGAPFLSLFDSDFSISLSNPAWMMRAHESGFFQIATTVDYDNYSYLFSLSKNGRLAIGSSVTPRAYLDLTTLMPSNTLGSVLGRMAEGNATGDGTYLGVRVFDTQLSNFDGKGFALEHSFYGNVNSSISFYRGSNTVGGFITISTNSNKERMRITKDGNVGIGTVQPSGKLDVFGNNSSSTNLVLSANYPDRYRWRFITVDRGQAIDLDITASDNTDTQEPTIRLSRSSSGRPEFALLESVLVANNGKIGIGTNAPSSSLHVKVPSADVVKIHNSTGGAENAAGLDFCTFSGEGRNARIAAIDKGAWNGDLAFYTDNDNIQNTNTTERMRITSDGNVGIGTSSPGSFRLAVEGKIGAREIVVTTSSWADYVFDSTYNLPPLSEVEAYVKTNKHLPEIPSEAEVKENGVAVGEMNALLLKKIEELTLYVIEQNKLIESQGQIMSQMQTEIQELKSVKN